MYDTSLRVPCIIVWPGVTKAGGTLSESVSNVDWFPTLLSMCGVKMPEEIKQRGRDFTDLLKGKKIKWDNTHYSEYDMRTGARVQMRCLRTPEAKIMIDFLNEKRGELYDLKNDPQEKKNLYFDKEHSALRKVFTKKF